MIYQIIGDPRIEWRGKVIGQGRIKSECGDIRLQTERKAWHKLEITYIG